jgi:hypothetical protein
MPAGSAPTVNDRKLTKRPLDALCGSSAGRGRPPQAAARRPALKVVEKVLTTGILKAKRTALRAVKRQGIVAP